MELYGVVCKAKDDLMVNPPDKTNKRKANDEENNERRARLVAVMIAVQHQALKEVSLKIHQRREIFIEDDGWDRASDFGI
ncbi:hypothetical protein Tco_0556698 [Tanacetum coccineum]